jgi:hypothetical protein
MKHPFLTLLLATLCAVSGYAQTIKSLGYNTTNGHVVYSGTNTLRVPPINVDGQAFFNGNTLTWESESRLDLETRNLQGGSWTVEGAILPTDIDGTKNHLGLGSEQDATFRSVRYGYGIVQEFGLILDAVGVGWYSTNTNLPPVTNPSRIIDFGTESVNVRVPMTFSNAATTRTNLGLPLQALTNTSNADFRTAIGLGSAATNPASAFQPASANLTNLAANNAANLTNFPALLLRTNGSAAGLTNFPTLNQNTTGTASNVTGVVAIANGGTGATNASNARTALGLGETNNVTFSNVTANGTLTVGSIATTAPVSWALDAVQTAAGTNGVLDLPLTANVLRITNANTISAITNGRLGAFYFLLNQSGTNLVISNSATITARGATNLTLGANQSATLISTTATNATVH